MRTYLRVRGRDVTEVTAEVVREQPVSVYVNGEKFLTLLCSPMGLEDLIVGYLWMEKVIGDVAEIARLEVSPVDGRAHEGSLPGGRALPALAGYSWRRARRRRSAAHRGRGRRPSQRRGQGEGRG